MDKTLAENNMKKYYGTVANFYKDADDPEYEISLFQDGYEANQQLAEYKEKLKSYMQGRLDKVMKEMEDCTPEHDAFNILNGHKYELIHLLKEIDTL